VAKTKNKKNAKQQKSSDHSRSTVAKATAGVVAGTAAVGAAGYAAVKRTRQQPKVLGVKVPAGMTPSELDPRKLAKKASKRFS
jgi:hypothetical protein